MEDTNNTPVSGTSNTLNGTSNLSKTGKDRISKTYTRELDQSSHSEKSSKKSRKGSESGSTRSGKLNSLLDSVRKSFVFCIGREITEFSDDNDIPLDEMSDERVNYISTGMISPSVEVTGPCCGKNKTDEDDINQYEAVATGFDEQAQAAEENAAESAKSELEEEGSPIAEGSLKSEKSEKSVKKTKSKQSVVSTSSKSPKALFQGLIFPPSPRQTIDDMLAKPPPIVPLTLFTNVELDDMFKPGTIIPNKNYKICRSPSFVEVPTVRPRKDQLTEKTKSFYESFASYFQEPVVEPNTDISTKSEFRCHEAH